MGNENFVKVGRQEVEFSELSHKTCTEVKHFLKKSLNEKFNFIERPKKTWHN